MTKMSRRRFVTNVAATGAGLRSCRATCSASGFTAPSDTLNVAAVGVGGQGRANLVNLASENVVALCDVDWDYAGKAFAALDTDIRNQQERLDRTTPRVDAQGRPGDAAHRDRARADADQHRADEAPEGRAPAARDALSGLPPDARSAEGHRRRRHRDARSHARDDRARGDGSRQARLRAEAADLVGRRSAPARAQGEEHEGRHADGQPGALLGRRADGGGVRVGRRDRRRARSPRLDEPAARLLAAGHSASGSAHAAAERIPLERTRARGAARHGDGRQLSEAGRARVGSVPRRRAVRRVSPGLSPVQLARLGRLGLRRDRRHGRAPDGPLDVGARSRLPDDDRNRGDAVQRRLLPERDDDDLRVPRAQREAAGEADVVRRRAEAAEAGRAAEKARS